MIASVAKSLQQFRDDNVTENQGRDHMVEQVPRPVRDRRPTTSAISRDHG